MNSNKIHFLWLGGEIFLRKFFEIEKIKNYVSFNELVLSHFLFAFPFKYRGVPVYPQQHE